MTTMNFPQLWMTLFCFSLDQEESQGVAHTRRYLYVGGGYLDNGTGLHTFPNQMYVEHPSPVNIDIQSTPIVMIHGLGQTGTVREPQSSLQTFTNAER
jgi:hypothetical protein